MFDQTHELVFEIIVGRRAQIEFFDFCEELLIGIEIPFDGNASKPVPEVFQAVSIETSS